MDLAYACADVIVSRSGASSVSEICAAQKAAVFVPPPTWPKTIRPTTPWRSSARTRP